MAFYSVRVDDEGKEIASSRRSYRNMCLDSLSKTSRSICENSLENLSSRTITNNYKTVRYVNSATFIEKDMQAAKKPAALKNPSDEEKGADSDEVADTQYQTHISTECNTIPLLELNSDESFPSSQNMSYSYRKVCEAAKMIPKPDAYKEWLEAKKTAKYFEQKKKQEKEREEEQRREQRKLLAKKKYEEWVARKNMRKNEKHTKESKAVPDVEPVEQKQKDNEEDRLEKQRNFQAWLKKKIDQEKLEKEKVNEELKRQMQLEKIRRRHAKTIYKEWLKTAVEKPKPVPLNRGLLTLKGSISRMYINPVPWVAVDSEGSSPF